MARSCEDLTGKEDAKNPFLFSNFVKNDRKSEKSAKVWNNFDSSNESIDHAPFPDLGVKGFKTKSSGKVKRKGNKRILKIVDDEIQKLDEEDADVLPKVENACSAAMVSSSTSDSDNDADDCSDCSDNSSLLEASYILPSNNKSLKVQESFQMRIKELEEQNEILKDKLLEAEKNAVDEKERNKKRIEMLIEEVKMAKKKELEETAALESVVHMVEENLRLTTQRALKAEAANSKLKDEIKFLKEDSIPRSKYIQLLEEYEYGMESVRQKSRDAARLMRVASNKAEPLVKELLSGISSLRFFAEQFDNIDKIAEVDPTRDRVV